MCCSHHVGLDHLNKLNECKRVCNELVTKDDENKEEPKIKVVKKGDKKVGKNKFDKKKVNKADKKVGKKGNRKAGKKGDKKVGKKADKKVVKKADKNVTNKVGKPVKLNEDKRLFQESENREKDIRNGKNIEESNKIIENPSTKNINFPPQTQKTVERRSSLNKQN
jgi:hypothetical protein